MVQAGTSDRVRRNRNAFRKHQPALWKTLGRIEATASTLVGEGDRAENIDLGDIRLYPDKAAEWTAAQLDQYFRNPDQVGFGDPSHCNISPVSRRLLRRLLDYMNEHDLVRVASYPVVDVGFAFVFGVGLGHHILELVRRDVARHLVLIEPVPEFIVHSFSSIDWDQVFREAKKKKIQIHFLTNNDPDLNVQAIDFLIRKYGATFLDGSHAYVHYYSWSLHRARALLNERIKNHFISSGYFEDEVIMMQNTYTNLRRWSFRLVVRQPHLEQDMPVFIVGSGPSLDKDLPYLKKWRDCALIVSCGTGLGALLSNGIRPDLHVENENTPQLVNNLKDFKRRYGLEGIRLVVTTTVNPEVSGLFDRRWYFFRVMLSSSTLLAGSALPLPGSDPLVSNAAFSVMATVGFKNIYLFGVDCGRRAGTPHHSRDAVYYQEGYDNWADGEGLDFIERQLNREVPANFGGKAYTSWSMDLSRLAMAAFQRTRKVNLYNCSDGARIDGARPKAAVAIELTNPPDRQEAVLAQVERQLQAFAPGKFLDQVDLAPDIEACDRFAEAFSKLIATAKRRDKGFWELEQRLEKFWDENFAAYRGVLKMIGGSYASMVRLGAFMGNRIPDEKARRAYMRFFLDEYRDVCLWMADEVKKLLQEMLERKAELSEIGVIEGEETAPTQAAE